MRKRLWVSVICTLSVAMMNSLSIALAEDPPVSQVEKGDPTIDVDGQKICGYDLMNDSEKAGYRNLMHKTKVRADRDEIRMYHCEAMKKRAAEKAAAPAK